MAKSKPEAAFLCDSPENIMKVYGQGRMETLGRLVNLHPEIISGKETGRYKDLLSGCESIFSTWGMPSLGEKQIEEFGCLKAVFYAAGSVKHFAQPFLEKGIKVISAWGANAKPTASFALAQVLLSCKGYFRAAREYRAEKSGVWTRVKAGIYGSKVGIIGAGQVGRTLMEMLKPFGLEVLVTDPYFSEKQAKKYGARKATLERVFKECGVISNHMPDIKETKGMLGGRLFLSMPENAVFINTGRGAQVRENDLIKVFKKRKDLTALLDVTFPEPPDEGSELFSLPNVILSPHIAGAYGKEQVLLADCVIDECRAMIAGKPLKYEIKLKMIKHMG